MKRLVALPTTLLYLPLLSLLVAPLGAQPSRGLAPDDELFRTVAALDKALFDAYNHCDVEKFSAFFVDDVEFYHDQTGMTRGIGSLTEALENNICGKVRRELVPATLEVYPMHGYGAVEMGVHRFHSPADSSEATGEAKFIHLWQNQDGGWKVTRVISFDHRPPGE